MNKLPLSVQRILAVLILLVPVLILVSFLQPLADRFVQKQQQVELLSAKLSRYQLLLGQKNNIQQYQQQLLQNESQEQLFLEGENQAIAAANLQEFINKAVRDSGGQLISTQSYQPETALLTPVGLRVQVTGETPNLIRFLHSLEDALPLIFIDQLTINATSANRLRARRLARNRARDRQQQTSERFSLSIRMDLVSYLGQPEVQGGQDES